MNSRSKEINIPRNSILKTTLITNIYSVLLTVCIKHGAKNNLGR
jgi:hypothetical protein